MSGQAVGFSPPRIAIERVETRDGAGDDVHHALKGGVSVLLLTRLDCSRRLLSQARRSARWVTTSAARIVQYLYCNVTLSGG